MKPLAWPFVATVLLFVGAVAWCLSITRGPLCEGGCNDRLPDGECLDCGLPAAKGVNP